MTIACYSLNIGSDTGNSYRVCHKSLLGSATTERVTHCHLLLSKAAKEYRQMPPFSWLIICLMTDEGEKIYYHSLQLNTGK